MNFVMNHQLIRIPDQDICISANVNPLFSTPIKAGELDSEKESDDCSFILESTAGSVSDSASSCDCDTKMIFSSRIS